MSYQKKFTIQGTGIVMAVFALHSANGPSNVNLTLRNFHSLPLLRSHCRERITLQRARLSKPLFSYFCCLNANALSRERRGDATAGATINLPSETEAGMQGCGHAEV